MPFNLFKSRLKRLQEDTDFGRRFGWEVWFNGTHVADLEYERWLEDTQFWHAYRVTWLRESDLVGVPYADWSERGVSLQNRRFPSFRSSHFMAAGASGGSIILRGLYVSDEHLATAGKSSLP